MHESCKQACQAQAMHTVGLSRQQRVPARLGLTTPPSLSHTHVPSQTLVVRTFKHRTREVVWWCTEKIISIDDNMARVLKRGRVCACTQCKVMVGGGCPSRHNLPLVLSQSHTRSHTANNSLHHNQLRRMSSSFKLERSYCATGRSYASAWQNTADVIA